MKTINFFVNEHTHYSVLYNQNTMEIEEIYKCSPVLIDEFLDAVAIKAAEQGEDSINNTTIRLVKENFGKEFFRKVKRFVKLLK